MKALQRADQALGVAACALLQPLRLVRAREAEYPPKRVLVIKFWGLGSLQLLTPAIAALAEKTGRDLHLAMLGHGDLNAELTAFAERETGTLLRV